MSVIDWLAIGFSIQTVILVILAAQGADAAATAKDAKRLGEAAQRRISRLQGKINGKEQKDI